MIGRRDGYVHVRGGSTSAGGGGGGGAGGGGGGEEGARCAQCGSSSIVHENHEGEELMVRGRGRGGGC